MAVHREGHDLLVVEVAIEHAERRGAPSGDQLEPFQRAMRPAVTLPAIVKSPPA